MTDPMTRDGDVSAGDGEQDDDELTPVYVTVKTGTSVYHLPEDDQLSVCRQNRDFVTTYREQAEQAGLSICSECAKVGGVTKEELVRQVRNILDLEGDRPHLSKDEYAQLIERLGGSK